MAIEIEAKMRVEDFGALRAALKSSGAELVAQITETNTFFDTHDRALLAKDSGLRLRINRYADGRQTFALTFKGPLQSGALKTREEIQTAVDDPNAVVEILARLGYVAQLTFEKRRESWTLDDCNIE